jgi:hypothetical protein
MTARNSGSHLLVEVSAELFADLLRNYYIETPAGIRVACAIWPSASATIELATTGVGEATYRARLADGTMFESVLTLKFLVEQAIDLMVAARLALVGGSAPTTLHDKVDFLLADSLPLRVSPTGTLLPGHVSLSEVVFGSADIVVTDFDFRVVGGGSALAVAVFFGSASDPAAIVLAGQNAGAFAGFMADFRQGRDLGVAVSVELLDRFVVQRAEVQAMFRQSLPPEIYTPEDPANFVHMSIEPPVRHQHRLRLSGRGEFQTEDCGGVDADWWVIIAPSIRDGFLKARVEFDYDSDFWDGVQVALCFIGNVALGAGLGFLAAGAVGSIVGGILNFPSLGGPSGPGSGTSSLTSCGDQCFEVVIANPLSSDGTVTFQIGGGQTITGKHIDVDEFGVTVWADMTRTFRTSALEIRDVRPWILATAESACAGGALEYTPASFLLYNPHPPYQSEFDWPTVCSIQLSAELQPLAEVILMPQNVPPAGPFRVHGVHQQRVEIRRKPGVAVANQVSGVAIIKTNTPPTTRTAQVIIPAPGAGAVEVDPSVLEFEQRDEELVDLRSLRRRRLCQEPGAIAGRTVSVGGSFAVRNVGDGTLHVCDLVLNDPAGVFELPVHRRFSLLPGSEHHVALVLNANANVNQQYTGTVSVLSTDPANPQLAVTVRGTALTPPRGVNVGGPLVLVDNFFDSACLELRQTPGEGPPIVELEKWKDLFTDPTPVAPESISVFEIGVRAAAGKLDVIIGDRDQVIARSGADRGPSVTLLDRQMKAATVRGLRDGEATHVRASSFAISPIAEFRSGGRVNDVWISGKTAAMATDDGLEAISIADPEKPQRLRTIPAAGLRRLEGTRRALYGVGATGLDVFTLEPALDRRSHLDVQGASDVAAVEDIAYLLTTDAVLVVAVETNGTPVVLHRIHVDRGQTQIMASPSTMYSFGNEEVTTFSLAKPWLPERLGTTRMRGVKSISHWGTSLSARGEQDTRILDVTARGELAEIAVHPGGHWADRFRADRHHRLLFTVRPAGDGFRLWRIRRRDARVSGARRARRASDAPPAT